MEKITVEIIGYDKYDSKKFTDNFGSNKKNPFKSIANTIAHFQDGSKIELLLKFTETKVGDEKAINKSIELLKRVGLTQ